MSVATFLGPFAVVTFGMGILMPTAYSGALAGHARIAGTASALIGVLQALASMVAGYIAGLVFDGTAAPITIQIAVFAVAMLGSFLVIVRPGRVARG